MDNFFISIPFFIYDKYLFVEKKIFFYCIFVKRIKTLPIYTYILLLLIKFFQKKHPCFDLRRKKTQVLISLFSKFSIFFIAIDSNVIFCSLPRLLLWIIDERKKNVKRKTPELNSAKILQYLNKNKTKNILYQK